MNEKCIISNLSETKFIKQGKNSLEIVAKQELATEFKPLKAQNLLINLPNGFKKTDNWKIIKFENEISKNQIDYIEETANQPYQQCFDVDMTYDKHQILDVLIKTIEEKDNEYQRLNNQLTKVSRAITDYNHFKEINAGKRSASQRCKDDIFYSQLLSQRRIIKQEMQLLEWIDELLNNEKYYKIIDKYRNFEKCNYVPRELDDLFKTGQFPDFKEWYNKK